MKFTAIAPSNIAFIKYWGKKDADLRLPTNGSISMNLSNLSTKTTVGFSLSYKEDKIDGDEPFSLKEKNRIIAHLDRIRKLAGVSTKAKIVTKNNFPIGTGLSSSASGFAALTLAASKALGLDLTEKELSIIARLGSGSACRSIPDGFVEWLKGNSSESSYARSIYAPGYWNLVDTVAIVNQGRKKISSSEGQRFVGTSPFYPKRLSHMENKIKTLKKYLKDKNFQSFGELIQLEALELHAIMLTSQPALIYMTPATLSLIKKVINWRKDGLAVYFTLNTGQDLHLITEEKDSDHLRRKLQQVREVKKIIVNRPSVGTRINNDHLF